MKNLNRTGISQKLNNVLYFLAGVLSVVIVVILVIGVQTKAQNTDPGDFSLNNSADTDTKGQEIAQSNAHESEVVEKWQEGTIDYKGKYYQYKNNLKNYLFMGIDTDDAVYNMDTKDTGYQSDAIFLVVADSKEEKLSVITINRNTMTQIERFTGSGVSMGKAVSQLCVQHAYGDGKKLSCSRVKNAVSELFSNIPIHGYVSMNMGAIPYMNDAIGGVNVTVLQDLDYESKGVNLRKGENVTLNGQEAYCYLRGRDINDFDSATDRLRRQEQYISSFLEKLKTSSDRATEIVNIYEAVDDYLVTDLNFSRVMESLLNYDYSPEDMFTVPGETRIGTDEHEEYYIDEEAFQDLIIEVFYEEK